MTAVPRPDAVERAAVDKAAVGRALVAALREVDGVRRLEPSLLTTLRRPALAAEVTALPVRVRTTAAGTRVADLTVDIAADRSAPAVRIADAVQRRAREILAEHDLQPGTVEVSVLAIEI